jgi:lambda repressor-like predicted transcriptional regulator
MLSINAQVKARAKMPITNTSRIGHLCAMRDWAIDYVMHVLETKEWSANRLASEAGLAASTIARPLRTLDYKDKLSRTTIAKIARASGIDPTPFIPAGFEEDKVTFSATAARPRTTADRVLAALDDAQVPTPPAQTNEIRIAVVGRLAQIVATVDKAGIAKLRARLDALDTMLDD